MRSKNLPERWRGFAKYESTHKTSWSTNVYLRNLNIEGWRLQKPLLNPRPFFVLGFEVEIHFLWLLQMAKRLLPLLNRVLIEKIVPPTKTNSGILLPEKSTKVNLPSLSPPFLFPFPFKQNVRYFVWNSSEIPFPLSFSLFSYPDSRNLRHWILWDDYTRFLSWVFF